MILITTLLNIGGIDMLSENEVRDLWESYMRVYIKTNRDTVLFGMKVLSKVLEVDDEAELKRFKEIEQEVK